MTVCIGIEQMQVKLTRSKNAKRNIFFGIVNKIITLFFPFIIRTVIIKEIGADYLGLSSLFVSVLQVLNITELGFSSAVVYSMYRPIAENDNETLCAILNFYRKVYAVIGLVIIVFGSLLIPFLPRLIKGSVPAEANIYLLYFVYLLATVASYLLFAYKNSLLSAYQRTDVISNINSLVQVFAFTIQFVLLVCTKNFLYYAIVLIFSSIISSVFTEIASRKLFPDVVCHGKLNETVKSEIKKKVKGLLVNKLCQTSRNAFDSIVVSAFFGLKLTAMYNNYFYIMNAIAMLMGIIMSSILAGVGNSIVTETQQKNYEDMKKINFIYMWIGGWCTVCLLCLYQPFTEFFFGRTMLLDFPAVILFCIYFYVLKMGDIRGTYSDARGLWWENRWRAVIEAGANIVLNIVFGKIFGIYGVIVATLISLFFINFLWGSTILYKYYFTEINVFEYYLHHLLYATATLVACYVTFFIAATVSVDGFIGIILRLSVCVVIPNLIFVAFYAKFREFKIAREWLSQILKK